MAWHVGRLLGQAGAQVVYSVRSEERRQSVARLLGGAEVYVCDVEREEQIAGLRQAVGQRQAPCAGLAVGGKKLELHRVTAPLRAQSARCPRRIQRARLNLCGR